MKNTKTTSATPKKRVSSTSKKAKNAIRAEIRAYFAPSIREFEGAKSALDGMKYQADFANCGYSNKRRFSDYQKAAYLVDGGDFACYYNDQRVMLGKIYGKKKVEEWSGDKVHETYKHLIAREYDAMLREREKRANSPKKPRTKPTTKKVTVRKPLTRTAKAKTTKKK